MTIVKSNQAKNLEIGTMINTSGGFIEIISEYDESHNGFMVAEIYIDDEGNGYRTGREYGMTLQDFVGCNY